MQVYDVIVIGGGPAGLAAALAAHEQGAARVLVIERDKTLGGILNQCIHNGFGLAWFKEELTGPEYADRFIRQLEDTPVEVLLDTMVLEVTPERTVYASSPRGYLALSARAIVLAMGCRERTRGAIALPGTRPAGILTAGAAQRYVNIEGYMVGRRVLILGSGDIGLIMARRMMLEGAEVLACVEVMPYSSGLERNIVQCLRDYQIPLYLSHTIVDVQGENRVERAVVARVDEQRRPIPGTELSFDCDTILLSVGLIPENELSRRVGVQMDAATGGPVVFEDMQTSVPGIYAGGNVLHVHDLADFVTQESMRAGRAAAQCALGKPAADERIIEVRCGRMASGAVPQRIRPGRVEGAAEIFFRVTAVRKNARIEVRGAQGLLTSFQRARVAPGEMERIRLPKELLTQAGDALTIQLAEEEHD